MVSNYTLSTIYKSCNNSFNSWRSRTKTKTGLGMLALTWNDKYMLTLQHSKILSGFLIKFHSMRSSLHKPSDAADHRGYIQNLCCFWKTQHTQHRGQTEVWPIRLCSIRWRWLFTRCLRLYCLTNYKNTLVCNHLHAAWGLMPSLRFLACRDWSQRSCDMLQRNIN